MVLTKLAHILNEMNVDCILYSNTYPAGVYNVAKYTVKLGNVIDDNTVVIYPEIIRGNPLHAKIVCRWILYYTSTRVYNTWKSSDILCSYGSYNGNLPCKFSISVVDFNEDVLCISDCIKSKKYYYVGKAHLNNGWSTPALTSEINRLQKIGYTEIKRNGAETMNRVFSECSVFISFDLNTYYSNMAVLCGCLSMIYKPPTDGRTYAQILEKRGCYGCIGIHPFDESLLDQEYNASERKKDELLYREYITTVNNVNDFLDYYKLR